MIDQTKKNLSNKFFFYASFILVSLMFASIFYLSIIKIINFWSFSQSHINYSEGFIKRGLFGSLMFFFENNFNISTKTFFSSFFIFFYSLNIVLYFVLIKKYLNNKLLFIFFVFCPTLLIFPFNDLGGYQRLDVLSITSILSHSIIAQFFYENKISKKQYKKFLFFFIFPFNIVSILFHEIQIFSLPFHFFVTFGVLNSSFLNVIKKYIVYLIPVFCIYFIYPDTASISNLSQNLSDREIWSNAYLFHTKNIGFQHYAHEIKINILNVYNLKIHLLMISLAIFPFILIFYYFKNSEYIILHSNSDLIIMYLVASPFFLGLIVGDFGRWVNLMSFVVFGYLCQFPFKNKLKEFKIFDKNFNNYLVNIIILFLVIFYILSIRIPHCCNLQKNNIDLFGGILNKSVAIINVLFNSSNQEKYDLNKRFK